MACISNCKLYTNYSGILIGCLPLASLAADANPFEMTELKRGSEPLRLVEAKCGGAAPIGPQLKAPSPESGGKSTTLYKYEICNRSVKRQWVALAFHGELGWESHGWFSIYPGDCAKYQTHMINNNIYFRANTAADQEVWKGDYGFCVDNTNAFDGRGYSNCSGQKLSRVGFRRDSTDSMHAYKTYLTISNSDEQLNTISRARVGSIQKQLAELGYVPGPVDGYMGQKTRSAIKAFQRDRGVQVNGKITSALFDSLAQQQNLAKEEESQAENKRREQQARYERELRERELQKVEQRKKAEPEPEYEPSGSSSGSVFGTIIGTIIQGTADVYKAKEEDKALMRDYEAKKREQQRQWEQLQRERQHQQDLERQKQIAEQNKRALELTQQSEEATRQQLEQLRQQQLQNQREQGGSNRGRIDNPSSDTGRSCVTGSNLPDKPSSALRPYCHSDYSSRGCFDKVHYVEFQNNCNAQMTVKYQFVGDSRGEQPVGISPGERRIVGCAEIKYGCSGEVNYGWYTYGR